jgi:hypothetical protein
MMRLRTKFTQNKVRRFAIRPSVAYRFAVYFSKRSLSEGCEGISRRTVLATLC